MIRLHLNPALLKSLNFNKKDDTLEVEFKDDIDASGCLDIPISILRDYVESIKQIGVLKSEKIYRPNLRIVYSNFKAS